MKSKKKVWVRKYKLPMHCNEFEAKGWRCSEENYRDISEDTPRAYVPFHKQGISSEVYCNLRFGTDKKIYIVGFNYSNKSDSEPDDNLQIEFPGGIILGKSTRKDIENAYGETSYGPSIDSSSLYYWREELVGISFKFSYTGHVNEVQFANDPFGY